MSRFATRALATALVIGAPAAAFAQGLPTSQPPYILVIREDVKLGRGAEHMKIEGGWVAAFERAKSPNFYLAMDSLTSDEAWFVIPEASFEAIGRDIASEHSGALGAELDRMRRVDAEVVNTSKSVLLRARPDLSNGSFPDMSRQRHWYVTVFRLHTGGEAVFEQVAKAYGAAAQDNRTFGYRVYEAAAGMPQPTFFVFSSVSGFGEFDKLHTEDVATIQKMLGAADQKMFADWNDKLISAENFILSLNPTMSYVPADVRASDPAFWKKPAPMTTSAKPSATEPAVKPASAQH